MLCGCSVLRGEKRRTKKEKNHTLNVEKLLSLVRIKLFRMKAEEGLSKESGYNVINCIFSYLAFIFVVQHYSFGPCHSCLSKSSLIISVHFLVGGLQ